MMNYQEIQPPDYLQDYVRYMWTLDNWGTNAVPTTLRPIVDGCPGLLFHQSEGGAFRQKDKELPNLFLYGQATQCAELTSGGKFRAIGVVLYPDALTSLFGFDADSMTDSCADLERVAQPPGLSLVERLVNTSAITAQTDVLASYLLSQIKRNQKEADRVTKYALSQIMASNGNISLKKLQEAVRLSERSLERRFKQCVGISPKLFARICRFQASLGQLRHNKYSKLSDIAFENDYADQSHFIRTFREFAGSSPYQFQKQSGNTAENFSLLT
ncbi:DUF6597 domain-containing transcriptional factor [Spirosoma soli]|uniref:DUF6597 domain-containing transcriptional factor n=1 Tax=Spirosoma soli TaxID=1770529 RepID=A0ABW5M9K3_9BACT